MRYLFCLLGLLYSAAGMATEPAAFPNAKMFSLSSEEMVFASKLSDANRRRFCYTFSVKERSLSMQNDDPTLSPDQKVDQIFLAFYEPLQSKAQTR